MSDQKNATWDSCTPRLRVRKGLVCLHLVLSLPSKNSFKVGSSWQSCCSFIRNEITVLSLLLCPWGQGVCNNGCHSVWVGRPTSRSPARQDLPISRGPSSSSQAALLAHSANVHGVSGTSGSGRQRQRRAQRDDIRRWRAGAAGMSAAAQEVKWGPGTPAAAGRAQPGQAAWATERPHTQPEQLRAARRALQTQMPEVTTQGGPSRQSLTTGARGRPPPGRRSALT